MAALVLAAIGAAAVAAVLRLWPANDPEAFAHNLYNLPLDHPHIGGQRKHIHSFVVDENHPRWAAKL